MKIYLFSLALSFITIPYAFGQEDTNQESLGQEETKLEETGQSIFWEAELPGGKYLVSLTRISSISMSKYYLKGLLVHEVDVETMGVALARFYAIELAGQSDGLKSVKNLNNRALEIVNQSADKAGVDADTAVHKEYPITTHSKTIEFRLNNVADLTALYDSLEKSWKSGLGRKFIIK